MNPLGVAFAQIAAAVTPVPPAPWTVLVHVCHDGTSVMLCSISEHANETITLTEYRDRYPAGGDWLERWYYMGDSAEQADQLCRHRG